MPTLRLPPECGIIENEILDFFSERNFERSRRFTKGAYDPTILKQALGALSNPQFNYRTLHVAGTVGKGSAAVLLARALAVMGKRTGTYLSPHFVSLTERILVDEVPLEQNALANAWRLLRDKINVENLSFFDAMTAIAFQEFKRARCEWAVIETGLGGRLDSTNNLKANAAIITRIGLDHTAILGNTIAQIAAEKAGIMHAGQIVYTPPQEIEALQVLESRAREVGATLKIVEPVGEDFLAQNQSFVRQIVLDIFPDAQYYLPQIDAVLAEPIFGRWSELSKNPRILFDSAHNAVGMDALAQLVNRQRESHCIIFLNSMTERNLSDLIFLLKEKIKKTVDFFLFPMPSRLYYTASPLPEILKAATDLGIKEEFSRHDTLFIFTGSMGIYKELRERFGL